MDKNKRNEDRRVLLEKMMESLREELVPATIREGDDQIPDILTILHSELGSEGDEILSECFFLPTEEDSPIQYFTTIYTITDELDAAHLGELFEAIAYLNFHLPYGAFGVDLEKKSLIFKLCAPLAIEVEGDELYREMDIIIGNSMLIVDSFAVPLLGINEGLSGIDRIKELLNE